MIPSVGQSSLAVAAAAAYYNATQLQGGCAGDSNGSMSPLSTLAAAAGSRSAGAAGQSPPVAAAGGQSLFGMGVPFQMPAASGVGFGVGGLVGGYGAAGGWSGGAYGGGGSGAGAGAYGYSPYAYGMGGAGAGLDLAATRRKNATKETTSTLKAWLQEHIKNPYPTKGEKIMYALHITML